jgi:hypothetical protein
MELSHLTRQLSAAVSLFFAVAAVALCVMWVRSYRTCDVFSIRDAKIGLYTNLGSDSGTFYVQRSTVELIPYPGDSLPRFSYGRLNPSPPQAVFVWNSNFAIGRPIGISFPYWLPICVAAGIAAFPWLHFRFSLRTLLITTTLVAVVLGLGVWAAGRFTFR